MNIDWINLNEKYIENLVDKSIKQSQKNIERILQYDCVSEKDKFLKLLEKDTIEINKIYSILSIFDFIINPCNTLNICNQKINNYNKKLKINTDFIKKLIYFNKLNYNSIELYQRKFIDNIINQLKYNKIVNNAEVFINGINIIDKLINIYNLENILCQSQKKDRQYIITTYNNYIYENLHNGLKSKFSEAKHNISNNYVCYKNNLIDNSIIELKNFISGFIKLINSEIIKKKENYKKQSYDYDDIIVLENEFNIGEIKLSFLINKYIDFFSNYFGLTFIKYNTKNLWNDKVLVYEIQKENKILGYLYLDLIKNNSQKPSIPVFININNSHYNSIYGINEVGQSCIFSAFESYNGNINFNNSQKLFIEFMLAIYNFYLFNNLGFSNIDIENKNMIEILAEKIFQSENFLKTIYDINNLKYKLEELQLLKLIKFRYLCIDSLFDIALHIDGDIVKFPAKSVFEKTYFDINKIYNIDGFTYNNLNPILLYKLNGDFGAKYYHLIFNEIICHNVSNLIIKKKIGRNFFEALTNIKTDFKTNLKEFLKKYNMINKNINFILNGTKIDSEYSEENQYKEL